MPSPVLSLLKYVFLAFLYLFFLRVLRAVWIELREPKTTESRPTEPGQPSASPSYPASYSPAGASAMTTMTPAIHGGRRPEEHEAQTMASVRAGPGGRLVVTSPAGLSGTTFPLSDELTIGRSPGCGVSLPDDTFVSSVHARVFKRSGEYLVEDLGSTNGTLLNDARVAGPARMQAGDRLRVGETTLELAT